MSDQLNFEVKAFFNLCTLGVDFLFFREISGRREVVLPITALIEPAAYSGEELEPSLRVNGHMAKQMLQALWDAGLRPNNGAGSGAEAAALRGHIKFAEDVASRLLTKVVK